VTLKLFIHLFSLFYKVSGLVNLLA